MKRETYMKQYVKFTLIVIKYLGHKTSIDFTDYCYKEENVVKYWRRMRKYYKPLPRAKRIKNGVIYF